MKLSSFDLGAYLKVPLVRRFSDEWSRPGLTNFLGSLQVDADPTGIRHPLFPPVSSADEATCYLTVNGDFLPSTGIPTTVRWSPYQVVRSCRWQTWDVHSVLVMAPDRQAIVQRITITSKARTPQPLDLAIRLSGRCVNRGIKHWFWGVPTVSTSVFELIQENGLDPLTSSIGASGILFQERAPDEEQQRLARRRNGGLTPDDFAEAGKAFNAQCLSPAPDKWLSNGDASYQRLIAPGQCLVIDFALAMDSTPAAAEAATRAVRQVPGMISTQEKRWRSIWTKVFRAKNAQGRLPDLELPEWLAPVAASATLNLLLCRRTHRVTKGDTFYNILTPRRCETCFYTWDWGLSTGALARLDPEAVRRQLQIAWKNDFRQFMQFNFATGESSGWPYTADVFSLFYATWNYWKKQGGTSEALRENIETRKGDRTMLDCLEELAFDWRARCNPKFGLADYGPKGHLLECVSTYAHMVAALNAGACWMLERVADAYELLGRSADASRLREESEELFKNLISHLYVKGGGYFSCLQPDGRKTECRHAYDLGMVLWCVGERLPKQMQNEMVSYFQRELQTPGWIRALSPHDRDAGVSGVRADHQFSGSYTAWAGLVALGLLRIGRRKIVEKWLRGIARTALQGPFGQAHWDERVVSPTAGGATKVTDEYPQGCHWCDISGAIYFTVVEEFLASKNR